MKLTYYGHSCFSLNLPNHTLLFDPFISGNPAAQHIDISSIKADYILISHGHQDHLLDAADIARRTNATLISNFEIITWFGKQSLKNGHAMNHGGSYSFPFGRVKYTNAIHSSSLPDGSYGGNPGGFVITPEGQRKSYYYAGDTALTYDMKLISEEFELGCAFLPIGDNYTMGINDAVRAAELTSTHKVVGLHYDTFPPIVIDKTKALAKFKETGITLLLPAIGETVTL